MKKIAKFFSLLLAAFVVFVFGYSISVHAKPTFIPIIKEDPIQECVTTKTYDYSSFKSNDIHSEVVKVTKGDEDCTKTFKYLSCNKFLGDSWYHMMHNKHYNTTTGKLRYEEDILTIRLATSNNYGIYQEVLREYDGKKECIKLDLTNALDNFSFDYDFQLNNQTNRKDYYYMSEGTYTVNPNNYLGFSAKVKFYFTIVTLDSNNKEIAQSEKYTVVMNLYKGEDIEISYLKNHCTHKLLSLLEDGSEDNMEYVNSFEIQALFTNDSYYKITKISDSNYRLSYVIIPNNAFYYGTMYNGLPDIISHNLVSVKPWYGFKNVTNNDFVVDNMDNGYYIAKSIITPNNTRVFIPATGTYVNKTPSIDEIKNITVTYTRNNPSKLDPTESVKTSFRLLEGKGLVDSQSTFNGVVFAGNNLSKTGCGVVALHNAMVLLGKENYLYDVKKYVENRNLTSIPFNNSALGVAPHGITDYLANEHLLNDFGTGQWDAGRNTVEEITDYCNSNKAGKFKENIAKYDSCIFIVLVKHYSTAHYIAVEKSNGTYTAYNDSASSSTNIDDILQGRDVFGYWILNEKLVDVKKS